VLAVKKRGLDLYELNKKWNPKKGRAGHPVRLLFKTGTAVPWNGTK